MKLTEALSAFFTVQPSYCESYGNGHINDTFLVVTDKRYILQRMNSRVFPQPQAVMENIVGITEHIRKKARDNGKDASRATLTVVSTIDGKDYFCDSEGEYWRLYEYTEGTVARDRVESMEDFYNCAAAFGEFQGMLADYPAQNLHETIANFHNTPWRYQKLMDAVHKDPCSRLGGVLNEVAFAKERERFCETLERARAAGKLPLRVTHNDTKLNNILFDESTGEPVCVIDLDTVMPGYSVNDFGDSIRF